MPEFIRTYDLNIFFREPNADGHPSHIKSKHAFVTAAILDLAHKHKDYELQYKPMIGYPKLLEDDSEIVGYHIITGLQYACDMPFVFYAMRDLLNNSTFIRKEIIQITPIIDDLVKMPIKKIPEDNEIILDLTLTNIVSHPAMF